MPGWISSQLAVFEGIVSVLLDVCRIGGAWCSGVMEEESVAVPISNEEVEVTVAIGIGEGWIGVCTNISNAEGCLSPSWMYAGAVALTKLPLGLMLSGTPMIRSALAARDPAAPGSARVRKAELPATSVMLPPLSSRAVEES